MATCNFVALMGNLVADIELRRLPSGMAVADMRLAVSEKFKNKSGEMVEKTVFVDISVWDRQAENCAQYLRKGSPVFIEGRLQLDEWTTKEGEKRSKLRVRADTVQFLGRSSQTENAGSQAGPRPAVEPENDDFPFGTGGDKDETRSKAPKNDDEVLPF